jgi:MYXO-CTERM domain-containing protein
MGACEDGFADCDTLPASGCEASLSGNQNCGACGVVCTSPETCVDLGAGYVCSAACEDSDGDGHAAENCGGDDCDDSNAGVHPDEAETCNQVDDNCDGQTDEGLDADKDGYDTCAAPIDCNDEDDTVHPGADEICGDGIDQDCSGRDLDCDCPDADGDGSFDQTCGGTDCDDAAANIYPGADEICGDGIDQDCDGEDRPCACADADQDGHQNAQCGGDDCDDSNAAVHPGATEICDDSRDNDCNNLSDADDPACQDEGGNGCGCSAGETSSNHALFGLLGLLALAGLRRKRS